MEHIRKIKKSFVYMLLISFMFIYSASAASPKQATTKSLSTNYTLVNMSTTDDATVVVKYLKEDGSNWPADTANTTFTIGKNFKQKIIAQYFDSTMTNGRGSAIIQSNTQLGAVVQILARNQTPSSGAYSGISSPSSSYYVPLVQKKLNTASGISNTIIVVQNAEVISQQVTINFIAYPGIGGISNHTKTLNIPPESSSYYDVTSENLLEDGWTGSAVVAAESGKKVVVVASTFLGPNTMTTYNAFPVEAAGKNWGIPLFTSRLLNGLNTSVSIQNVSGAAIPANGITLTCKAGSGFSPATFTKQNTNPIPNNASFAVNPVVDTSIPGNWSGSCLLNSSGDVVVIVTLRSPGYNENSGAYEAFNLDTSIDTRVVVPLMSKRQANGFATVATIQNLDTSNSVDVKLTYTPSAEYTGSSAPVVLNKTIPAGGNLIQNFRLADGVPEIPDGWFGTLLVEPVGTPRPIVAFVQLTNILNPQGDTLLTHNAFTLP
ncbi:MAG: hypothetical protein ABIK73_08835 [candidate division WOR-3 bacterium]